MTAATFPVEDMLQQTLDRLARQEQRMEAIEASMLRPQPSAVHGILPSHDDPWPSGGQTVAPQNDRLRELETRLAQAEERVRVGNRFETLGRLASGVAHDFNNLLTVLAGGSETIRLGLPEGHPLRDIADAMLDTAQLAASLTRQLLTFGKPHTTETSMLDPNRVVESTVRVLRRLTGERVAIELFLGEQLPAIKLESGQLEQVLMNLVVNARDAIVGEGTITIRTAVVTTSSDRVGWPEDIAPGEYIALTITDTGVGMTSDVASQIFDPFFTTKGDGGTGIGLSTVHDLVRRAGGHIEVESAPGWGTSFRVFWPAFTSFVGLRLYR